jgi:mono/diheme cytochrome c family protein
MKHTKIHIRAVLLIAVILSIFATPAVFADGKAIYETQCAKCHGPDGKGNTKMGQKLNTKDYSSPKTWEALKPGADIKAVKQGLKDGGKTLMKPSDGITESEAKAVSDYMRTLSKK